MINIRVLFFSQIREAVGTHEESMTVPDSATVGEAVAQILKTFQLERYRALPMRYAINEVFVPLGEYLHAEDRLALIPPVAGG